MTNIPVCMFVGNRNDVSWNGVNFSPDSTRCIDVPEAAVEELKHHGLIEVTSDELLGGLLAAYEKELAAIEDEHHKAAAEMGNIAVRRGKKDDDAPSRLKPRLTLRRK